MSGAKSNGLKLKEAETANIYESIEEVSLGTNDDFSGLGCRFRIKWSVTKADFVKAKEVSYYSDINPADSGSDDKHSTICHISHPSSSNSSDLQVVRSKLYNLASFGNIGFYLELSFYKGRYLVNVSNQSGLPDTCVELQYAFIALDNHVFGLTNPVGSKTLQNIQERPLSPTELFRRINAQFPKCTVDIYAMVKILSDAATLESMGHSDPTADSNSTIDSDSSKSSFSSTMSNFSISDDVKCATSYVEKISIEKELWQFWNCGKLPVLDTEKAKLLIVSSRVLKVNAFRAFGVEFLRQSLNKNTVLDFLAFSISNDVAYLKDECFKFLFEKCKIVKICAKKERLSVV